MDSTLVGRGTVPLLEMQWPRKLMDLKLTLVRVDYEAMFGEGGEKSTKILQVLLLTVTGHKYVIQVDKNSRKTWENGVHHALKGLCCILEAKWNTEELKEAKKGDDGCLWYVLSGHCYLVVTSLEVHLGENDLAGQIGREIMYEWHRIVVRGGDVVQPLVIPARSPTAILLLYQVKWARPADVGSANDSHLLHLVKLCLGCNEIVWWETLCMGPHWGSCGGNVENHSMFSGQLRKGQGCQCWEFWKQLGVAGWSVCSEALHTNAVGWL